MAKEQIVVWDAGHSNTDPGAVGYVRERDIVVKVVDFAIEHMEANYKCKNVKTNPEDSLIQRCAMANVLKADLFVSVHANSTKKWEQGDGWEGLIYSTANEDLAECFEKYVKEAGQNSRGVKIRTDLAVLKYTKMKAILNEIAFVNTKKDINDWDEDHELKKMGIALAEAAADYLNLPKKKKTTSSGTKYKTLCDLNFRKTPGLNGTKRGVVKKGTVLTGTVNANGWLKTKFEGKTGYVRVKGEKEYCKKV